MPRRIMAYTWLSEGSQPVLAADGVVVSSFPSAGLAATVAAHYMVKMLDLPRIGRFESPDPNPIAVIQRGEVNPPIRVYGRKDLGVVLSEFPPSGAQASALATAILEGAETRKARMIVCFEGVVPHPGVDENPTDPDEQVWVAFSHKDPALVKAFKPTAARLLEDGVIGGVSGAMLVQGIGRSIPVAVLLVSARVSEGFPDHRAGATLIEAFDRLLPELKIDTGPLRVQAEQIERALRAAMRSHPRSTDRETKPPTEPTMYL